MIYSHRKSSSNSNSNNSSNSIRSQNQPSNLCILFITNIHMSTLKSTRTSNKTSHLVLRFLHNNNYNNSNILLSNFNNSNSRLTQSSKMDNNTPNNSNHNNSNKIWIHHHLITLQYLCLQLKQLLICRRIRFIRTLSMRETRRNSNRKKIPADSIRFPKTTTTLTMIHLFCIVFHVKHPASRWRTTSRDYIRIIMSRMSRKHSLNYKR